MNDSNDIQALRAKLHGTRGRTYWRSLEESLEPLNSRNFCIASSRRTRRNGSTRSAAADS